MKTKPMSASLEDYLEAIYNLIQKKRVARSKDISGQLGVTGAAVTGALHALSEKKLIHYTPYEFVTLTAEGERIAAGVVDRHETLKEFFVTVLGLDEKEASENACRVEHAISEKLQKRLTLLIEFFRVCPQAETGWLERFSEFCGQEGSDECKGECRQCLS